MSIRLEDGLSGITQVMELAELMRDIWEHKSDGTTDRFLPIGDDPSHRNGKSVLDCL